MIAPCEDAQSVYSLAFGPDGRILATGDQEGVVRMRDTSSGRLLRESPGHRRQISSLAFSPDGTILVSGGKDGLIRLWDAASGATIRVLQP